MKQFGRIDIVFNNAGSVAIGEAKARSEETAHSMFDVNCRGAANVSKEAVPRVFCVFNKPMGGQLLQVSSTGHRAVPRHGDEQIWRVRHGPMFKQFDLHELSAGGIQ